jgi:hypothetical protein
VTHYIQITESESDGAYAEWMQEQLRQACRDIHETLSRPDSPLFPVF